jgi:hypothetical protein
MKSTRTRLHGFGWLAAVLIAAAPAASAQQAYVWESQAPVLVSPNAELLEMATGQVPFTNDGNIYLVFGHAKGTFRYDPAAGQPELTPEGFVFRHGPVLDWTAQLYGIGGELLATITGEVGASVIGDRNVGDDLFNLQACLPTCGVGYHGFDVGRYVNIGSSVVWRGGQFLDGTEMPATLPPGPSDARLAVFSYVDPDAPPGTLPTFIVGPDVTIRPAAIPVAIDIQPGSDDNCININGHGIIPVAVLGSAALDVAAIDQGSLALAGLGVRVRGKAPPCAPEDINADGIPDLVCHFEDDAGAWSAGDGIAELTGNLSDSTPIIGSDAICLVP